MTKAYARGVTDVPLLTDTIGANLRATALRCPEREALVDVPSGRRWTYAALSGEVERLARALMNCGLTKGERIGIWAPNVPEWTLTQYASACIGAILVNINPAYRSHELRYVLQQSGIRLLIATEAFKTSDYRQLIEEVRRECPSLDRVVYVKIVENYPMTVTGKIRKVEMRELSIEELGLQDVAKIQHA